MAVVAADLILNYPELAPLYAEDSALITAVLGRAERRVSATWTAATRDDYVMAVAARMLAQGPWGRNANLSKPDGTTTYDQEIKERKLAETCGRARVVGSE